MNFYKDCASILAKLADRKGSIKSLVSALKEGDRKRGAALVIETLKYQPVLLEVVEASAIMQSERKILRDKNLVLLLVHDLLFAKGIQAADGPIKQAVLKHKTRLSAELVKAQVKRGVTRKEDLAVSNTEAINMRRWVRINTLRSTEEEILSLLRDEGFQEGSTGIAENDVHAFWRDLHVPHLLSFHSRAQLQESSIVQSGKVILQDKASCFPATVLDPPPDPNAHIIDATAAPGNKTTHLSALMNGRGRITAFERDKKRFRTLEAMVKRAGASNVTVKNQDFLTIDPLDPDYANVTHILLDPSCSGSGIVNRMDHLLPQENGDSDVNQSEERLRKLSVFQLKMILHAMKFPGLKRLVYSTCSIHATENEAVVREALNSHEAHLGKFITASKETVIPSWHRRGLASEVAGAESFIRCLPEDGTNGFFVACLVRDDSETETLKRKASVVDEGDHDEEWKGIVLDETSDRHPKKKRKKRQRSGSKNGHPSSEQMV